MDGIPTQMLDKAASVKGEDTVVGTQDGKTRNFLVKDVRGINDNKACDDTTYSSEKIEKIVKSLVNLSDEDVTLLVNALDELESKKADKQDETLKTKDKTLSGGINELKELVDINTDAIDKLTVQQGSGAVTKKVLFEGSCSSGEIILSDNMMNYKTIIFDIEYDNDYEYGIVYDNIGEFFISRTNVYNKVLYFHSMKLMLNDWDTEGTELSIWGEKNYKLSNGSFVEVTNDDKKMKITKIVGMN